MTEHSERTAIVTGAAQGIGRAIAETLAGQGAKVAVVDLNEEKAAETVHSILDRGGQAKFYQCDVGSSAAADQTVAAVADDLGAPVILVNNAGVTRDNLIHKMTDEDWNLVITTHLTGSFNMARAVQRHMVERRWGKIVFISSRAAQGNRGQTNYSAAKAGLIGMMRALALELGPFDINVNAVAPGHVDTEMTRRTAARMGMEYEDAVAASLRLQAIKRVGQPIDIANAVEYLVSDRSSFVTGQVLTVSGRVN